MKVGKLYLYFNKGKTKLNEQPNVGILASTTTCIVTECLKKIKMIMEKSRFILSVMTAADLSLAYFLKEANLLLPSPTLKQQ